VPATPTHYEEEILFVLAATAKNAPQKKATGFGRRLLQERCFS
jgi:hypothetical protein